MTGAFRLMLSTWLARWALRCPRVLLVTCPGATDLRIEAQSAVVALDGRMADAPTDADVLLVLGSPSGSLLDAVEELWAQIPGPRVRVNVTEHGQVERRLQGVLPRLSEPEQEADAQSRNDAWQRTAEEDESESPEAGGASSHLKASGGSASGEQGEYKREDGHSDESEHRGHGGHGGHAGHEEKGGQGDMPGGLPMADAGADRDGLKLDVLHVPLGPVLPCWPQGLVLDTWLQGDVVQQTEARLVASVPPVGPPYWSDAIDPEVLRRRVAASHLDSMSRLLALAGWKWAEVGAVCIRNRLLTAEPETYVREEFGRWRRRVEGSVLLRWATDGLGVLGPARAGELGVGGPASRAAEPWDATARWRQWLAETDELLRGARVPGGGPRGRPDPEQPPSQALVAAVVELMPGLDLLDARLLVASFDPDPDELAQAGKNADTTVRGAR